MANTAIGLAPPAQVNTKPIGRYRFRPAADALETPVIDVTLRDLRTTLVNALLDQRAAIRDGRKKDIAKYNELALLAARALHRFEAHEERARIAAGGTK